MFYVKEPSTLNSAWILSHCKDSNLVVVPKDTLKDIKNYHLLGIDFLYQNYNKEFKGAILNEEDGMNVHLQVSAFLNAMFNSVKKKFLVLVLTPDHLLVNWHYHLTTHGGLRVQIISPNTCPEDFDQEHGLALLLSFSNIRLAEYLVDYDYFSVIIDNFEEVASKLIIKKLHGEFNIGLTQKNFYTNPDQKMQWTMLNWSNPGCVGKLGAFYEIDNDNFANFRDNYRHWWFRLTWNFCESFNRLSGEEKQEYAETLSKWARDHHLSNLPLIKVEKKSRKRKKIEIIDTDGDSERQTKATKISNEENTTDEKIINNTPKEDESDTKIKTNSQSSNDTIIYEDTEIKEERDPNYVELPSMDENPILNSIIRNFEKSPEPISIHQSYNFAVKYDLEQPNCSRAYEEEDVLLSIINDTDTNYTSLTLDHETQVSFKKEELLSQIFSDKPCTSRSLLPDDDNGFFESLVEPCDIQVKRSGGRSRSGDIDDILKETELLLKE